jgi:hypothetical protein
MGAAVAARAMALRPRAGPPASVVAGLVLIAWIGGEVLLVAGARSWVEAIYVASGLSMVALGLLVRRTRDRTTW